MELFFVLLVVAVLTFFTAWLFLKRLVKLKESEYKRELIHSRVGLSSHQFVKEQREYVRCWWCSFGSALAPKSGKDLQNIKQELAKVGYRRESDVGGFFFIKYSLFIFTGLVMVGMWSWFGLAIQWVLLTTVVMLLVPEKVVIYLGNRRLAKISEQLPDFLDMCNVCMNAGLSYLVAIKRVSEELHSFYPEICREFDYMLDQIQMGMTRNEALSLFAQRNPTKDIQHLTQILIQSEKLGTPISESLSEFSRRLYSQREEMLEEKAAKTSAKMALVMLPFLLLPYMILLLGERMVMLGRAF